MSTVATDPPREVHAQAKWVRSPARKARLVTDQIRGRTVPEARTILAFSQRAIAREVEKVLDSAVANVGSRPELADLNPDKMVIAAAYADEGPTMKRWRAVPPPPASEAKTETKQAKPRTRKTTSTRKTTTRKKTGAMS
jgi:large subunit ribosomal protein L22